MRKLTPLQQQRLANHQATRKDELETLVGSKRVIRIINEPTEKILRADDAPEYFSELVNMNVLLTNACNLSCSYCYEQHNRDFGRFTKESLFDAYNFLRDYSKIPNKIFQFFGGEPLIHKKLILEFLETYKQPLTDNYYSQNNQIVSLITNGLLLTKEFIEEYFSYDFTFMLFSLDTLDATKDHRELTQDQINFIVEIVNSIPEDCKFRVTARATISEENVDELENYIRTLSSKGIIKFIIQPLVLDSTRGLINWTEHNWAILNDILTKMAVEFPNTSFKFSEGVGTKYKNNCMVGSDMIAIDPSGDYSGCYFFTNQKTNFTRKMILGNIFTKTVYADRYSEFQNQYEDLFKHEQCKTCDYRNKCYQCPAGNLDTGPDLFRPDGMCQRIVGYFNKLEDLNNILNIKKLYLKLYNDHLSLGFNTLYKNTLTYLLKIYKRVDLDSNLDIGTDIVDIEKAWQKELNLQLRTDELWTVFSIYEYFYKVPFERSDNSIKDCILALCAIHPKIIKEL